MARSPRLLAESPQYGCRDQLSCLGWIIVLPDTHDQPADLGESGVGVPVPLDVATDLGGPVLDVGLRLDVVLGATVPVAAINECSYPSLPEDEIGPAVQLWERPSAYSVAQPEGVNGSTHCQLRLGVPALVALHRASYGR